MSAMTKFTYLAKRSPTEMVEGTLEAEDRANVITHLTGLGYTPVRITEAAKTAPGAAAPAPTAGKEARVPSRHLNQFTRQFASLIRSQVPILRALSILEEQTENPKLRRITRALAEGIRQGQNLSSAMETFPSVFSPLYVSLIRSGEAGGMMDSVLDRLAVQADRDEELQSKVQAALVYPLFVAAVGLCTVVFLLSFVVPRLVKLFSVFGSELPLPTRILLSLAGSLTHHWYLYASSLLGIVAAAFLVARSERGRLWASALRLRLPLLGPLTRQLEIVRFTRSFGLLLDHGLPILQATDVALPVVKNRILRKELALLPKHLKDGSTLSSGLKGLKFSTPFLVNTVAVGEESGKMGEALMEVSNFYERETGRLLQMMAALLEPATILIVGGMVGFIVFAVLLPILTMGAIAR